MKAKTRHFAITDFGGRGGLNVPFNLSKIVAAVNQPRIRSIWVRLQSDAWFDMVLTTYSEVQWYEDFRVTKTTFSFILSVGTRRHLGFDP